MTMQSGDWLLFLNNAVLNIAFIPTLLKKGSNIHSGTAFMYVLMIAVGASGYFMNGQYLPGSMASIGSGLWLVMLIKGLRR